MKILETFRYHIEILGFSPNQSLQSHPFNQRIMITFLMYNVCIYQESMYLFHGPENLLEYTRLFYTFGTIILIYVLFLRLTFQMKKLFQLILNTENLCKGKIKLQTLYSAHSQYHQKEIKIHLKPKTTFYRNGKY